MLMGNSFGGNGSWWILILLLMLGCGGETSGEEPFGDQLWLILLIYLLCGGGSSGQALYEAQ